MSLMDNSLGTQEPADTLLVGLGDLGSRIADRALALPGRVHGMRRRPIAVNGLQITPHDATMPWPDLGARPADVVFCLAPPDRSLEAYQSVYLQAAREAMTWLDGNAPQAHVWLISSTGVYGQSDGEWVDETSPAVPVRPGAEIIREAETLWLDSDRPATVLRLSGIYGPGRDRLIREAEKGYRIRSDGPVFTNRIHADDAAAAVIHLIRQRRSHPDVPDCINLTDPNPAPQQEVLAWLQSELGIQPDHDKEKEPGGKRVSSERLAGTGFHWQYPDYRAGYAALLSERGRQPMAR